MAFNQLSQIQPPAQRDMVGFPESLKMWYNQLLSWLHQQLGSFTNFKTVTNANVATQGLLNPGTDGYVLVDASLGAIVITLHRALTRKRYHIKKIDATANNVIVTAWNTVIPLVVDTIQGAATTSLTAQYKSVTLYSDGVSTWYIESQT